MKKFLALLANYKNSLFLSTCLYVHVTSFFYYLYCGATYLVLTNIISSIIYIILLVTAKRGNDRNIMIAFIEILMFSIVCELLTIGSCGFIYFSLGMVAVIFHLVSTTRFKKALLQLIGILTTFVIFYIDMTENDIAVRWGGEEFILFMPGTDINSAEKKLEKMQNTIREHQVKL